MGCLTNQLCIPAKLPSIRCRIYAKPGTFIMILLVLGSLLGCYIRRQIPSRDRSLTVASPSNDGIDLLLVMVVTSLLVSPYSHY